MLYVYFGNDAPRVRQKAFSFIHTLTKGEVIATHITHENYEQGMITDFAEGSSLFGGRHVVVIDTVSEDVLVFEQVLELLPLMEDSVNHFVLIEGTLRAPDKKKIHAHTKKVEEITGEAKEKFNAFLLTDAFLRKDKKSLWLLLMEAWSAGVSNEEIIGILFWQVKILRLVEKTESAEEAGQKPFVYSKAKRALSSFKKGELDACSRNLLSIYHDGHQGKVDTSRALEKWTLSI